MTNESFTTEQFAANDVRVVIEWARHVRHIRHVQRVTRVDSTIHHMSKLFPGPECFGLIACRVFVSIQVEFGLKDIMKAFYCCFCLFSVILLVLPLAFPPLLFSPPNDLYCVGWGIKLYSLTPPLLLLCASIQYLFYWWLLTVTCRFVRFAKLFGSEAIWHVNLSSQNI